MFVVRQAQLDLLSIVEIRTEADRTIEHIRNSFPERFAFLGEKAVREFVQIAGARAKKYGFKGSDQMCKYVEVMALFGAEFDGDLGPPWAAAVLRKRKKPVAKIEELHAVAIERWRRSQAKGMSSGH